MHDIKESVDLWLRNKNKIALATVVQTWGSSPRRIGAKMAINDEGKIIGSVSGGCVEAAVIQDAAQVLRRDTPALLDFGVADDQAWSVGLSCGGRLSVFVERLWPDWWRRIWPEIENHQGLATATALTGPDAGKKVACGAGGPLWKTPALSKELDSILTEAAVSGLEDRQTVRKTVTNFDVLVDCHLPKPRIVLVGGAHVAMALSTLAAALGFRVVLIDPRRVFASRERFPGAEAIYHDYPQDALPKLRLDSDTYVAVLTHDPKIDDPAMLGALPSPAPYVGVLSSRKTHEKRAARLLAAGLDPALLQRIQIPIGLDIGARTPEEIALAILGQIVAVRNRQSAG